MKRPRTRFDRVQYLDIAGQEVAATPHKPVPSNPPVGRIVYAPDCDEQKKWPDDFKGFDTNVKPKKAK